MYVDDDGAPRFVAARRLEDGDVKSLAETVAERVMRLLVRRGVIDDRELLPGMQADESPALVQLTTASALGLVATGERGGHPLDVQVSAAAGVAPRLSAEGKLLNGLDVALESHAGRPLVLRFTASHGGHAVELRPAGASLLPVEHKRIRVLVQVPLAPGEAPGELELRVSAADEPAVEQVVRVRVQGP